MTLTAPRHRPAVTTRRSGYVVAVLINAVLLYAVNVWPGWEAVPFLTADTVLVMGVVDASIIVNLAANAAYLITDPQWFTALGTVLTWVVGFVAAARIWRVFPFDFEAARSTGPSSRPGRAGPGDGRQCDRGHRERGDRSEERNNPIRLTRRAP